MASAFFFLLIPFFLVSASTQLQPTEEGFISVVISEKGLDFAKDILIEKAVSSLTPLYLPQIEKTLKIPVVGNVHFGLSDITIYGVDVHDSYVNPGDTGIVIVASGATANMSLNWSYSYKAWVVTVSDKGDAFVQAEGMKVGLTLALENKQGTLTLSLVECYCDVKDVDITLNGGGASWLYQGLVDAFEGQIKSSVENAITEKIKKEILKLDSKLKSLPKKIHVNEVIALNVTFVEDPVLSNSSIGFEIDGQFTAADKVVSSGTYFMNSQLSPSWEDPIKMLEISLDEAVFNSAFYIYYNAELMQWTVDKVQDQSLLNTASWKDIVPQLYRMYPDDDMNLDVSLSSPPVIKISPDNIDSTIYSDMTINVFNNNETISVACISLVGAASGSVDISRNNLVGSVELVDFAMTLKWSKIGDFHIHLIQSVIQSLLKTVVLPYVNSHLERGFPLPIIRGFTLQNADIFGANSQILVRSDVVFDDSYEPKLLPYDRFHSLLGFGLW